MADSDEDRGKSRRPGAEDQGWSSTGWVLGGWTIKMLGDAVYGLHRAQGDEECGFIGLASKPKSTVSPSLASKPVATVSLSLASKPVATVSPRLASKPVATVLVVWPQNHSLGFSDLGLKTGSHDLVIWPTKSPRRFLGLGLKTKWAMVCWLRHKTNGRMKTTRDTGQDLAAYFAWKRLRLRFSNLASRLIEA
jgi:hypothetical protein